MARMNYVSTNLCRNSSGDRGVIDTNGDIYSLKMVERNDKYFYGEVIPLHIDILWAMKSPYDYYDYGKTLCVEFYNGMFLLGESYNGNQIMSIRKSKASAKMVKKFKSKNSDKKLVLGSITNPVNGR